MYVIINPWVIDPKNGEDSSGALPTLHAVRKSTASEILERMRRVCVGTSTGQASHLTGRNVVAPVRASPATGRMVSISKWWCSIDMHECQEIRQSSSRYLVDCVLL